MGVRRLTNYVHYTNTLWTEIQLKDSLILVDGLALVWFLYQNTGKIDCRCGGEYDIFAKTIRHFFRSLTSKKVTPYVVIDGQCLCPGSRNENEIISSNKLSVEDCDAFVLPLMAKLAFVQELKNIDIRFAICDGEADQELAALANHWNCPIVSNDSDFFIYNLPAGYIPLSFLETSGPIITARLYKRHRLAKHLRIHEDFFPLFASLMGNDYVEEETLAPFHKALFPENETNIIKAKRLIMTIAKFISGFSSPTEALQSAVDLAAQNIDESDETDLDLESEVEIQSAVDLAAQNIDESDETDLDLESEVELSMSEYEISDNLLTGYFERNETRTEMETRHDNKIPAYVIRSYRDGRFPVGYMGTLVSSEGVQILKVQVEDPSEVSAHMCSIRIRCISYGIVTEGPTVIEYDRKKTELAYLEFCPFFGSNILGYGKMPNLKTLRDSDTSQRLKLLLVVLKADTALIKSLPKSFQMFAASVRYWISEAKPGVNQIWVQALLLVHLKLLSDSEYQESVKSRQKTKQKGQSRRRLGVRFEIKCQHSYAQWQSVMTETLMLNQILIFPLPEPEIATLYSGIAAQTIAQEIKQGAQVNSFVESLVLYEKLYEAATEGLLEKLV